MATRIDLFVKRLIFDCCCVLKLEEKRVKAFTTLLTSPSFSIKENAGDNVRDFIFSLHGVGVEKKSDTKFKNIEWEKEAALLRKMKIEENGVLDEEGFRGLYE